VKKLILNIVFILVYWNTFAQVSIEGTVTLYNSNHKPIKKASISILESEQSIDTNDDGYFMITVSGELDRDQIKIIVLPPKDGIYSNYQVVESMPIDITAGRERGVHISLWSKKDAEKRKLDLAQPYIENAIKKYENEIINLRQQYNDNKITLQQYSDSIKFKETELQKIEDNYNKLAESFSRWNPDYADTLQQKILYFFENLMLDSVEISLPEYGKILKSIDFNIKYFEIYRNLQKVKGNIEGVNKIYNDELNVTDPRKRFNTLINKAEDNLQYSSQNKNLLDTAFIAAQKANELSILKTENFSLHNKILSYNLLGKIAKEQGEKDYYKNYKKAITTYTGNRKDTLNYSEIQKNIAISYTFLAGYYKENKQKQLAENNYKKALDIYTALHKSEEPDNINYLQCLIETADFYSMTGKAMLLYQCAERIDTLMRITNLDEESQATNNMQMGKLNLNSNPFEAYIRYNMALRYYLTKESLIYKDKIVKAALGAALACNNDKYDYIKVIEYCDTISNRINIDSTAIGAAVHTLLGNAYKRGKDIKNEAKKKYHFDKAREISKKINDKKLGNFIYSIKNERWIMWRDWFIYPAIGFGAAYFLYLL